MTEHTHCELIEAKARNKELVVFENDQHGADDWYVIGEGKFPTNEKYSYFLCLPQHNKNGQCLHWLNGGAVQDDFEGEWSNCPLLSETINTDSENSLKFSYHHMFMNEEFHFRIAPKKEKRWIVYNPKSENVNDTLFTYKPHMASFPADCQFIEIEAEVST